MELFGLTAAGWPDWRGGDAVAGAAIGKEERAQIRQTSTELRDQTVKTVDGAVAQARSQARQITDDVYVARLLVAFLLGFVPMCLKSREHSSSLAEAKRQSSLARMENRFASAVIYAQRGDYETARQAASDFFTSLRTEFSRDVDSALSQAEIASLQPLLTQRDETITLLARGDVASADLLSDLYVAYRRLVNP